MAKIVRAVAGILQHGDRVFMASRPLGKVHALSWEFPGGKLENVETASEALVRELKEEIGVEAEVEDCSFLTFITQSYDHADVELYVMRVTKWRGEPSAREGAENANGVFEIGTEYLVPSTGYCRCDPLLSGQTQPRSSSPRLSVSAAKTQLRPLHRDSAPYSGINCTSSNLGEPRCPMSL